MRCPVVCFVRPVERWRNLSPASWDEFYITYPPDAAGTFGTLGIELAGHREIAIMPSLADELRVMSRLMESPHAPGNGDRIDGLAYQIMLECQIAALEPVSDDPAEQLVRAAASWIRLNHRGRPRLEAFLRGKGVTYRTFMRKWDSLYDKSPSQLALDLRMEEARRLLLETSLSVEQVSVQLGVDDPLYFSRLFLRREGVSPRQYRVRERALGKA